MLHKNQFFTKFVAMIIVAFVVSLIVVMSCMSVSAYGSADDVNAEDARPVVSYPVPKPVAPSGMKGYHMENFSGSNWGTIFSRTAHVNQTIYIESHNPYGYFDVRMHDWSGNIVWRENGWIPPCAYYQFDLGSNVKDVQLRITNATPIYASATAYW